jgi:hypothetical protein
MLITKRSRRRSEVFRSRFRDSTGNFPLRQYLRCREEVYSGTVHVIVLGAFIVAMILFGRSTWLLFDRHEIGRGPWLQRGLLLAIVLFILFLARRLWRRIQDLREVRTEMAQLRLALENLDDDARL